MFILLLIDRKVVTEESGVDKGQSGIKTDNVFIDFVNDFFERPMKQLVLQME